MFKNYFKRYKNNEKQRNKYQGNMENTECLWFSKRQWRSFEPFTVGAGLICSESLFQVC